MAFIPDECVHDAQYELVSGSGQVKHAAYYLYTYYCRRRNHKSGLCSAKLEATHADTGLPKSNISQLKSFLIENGWIHDYGKNLIRPLKGFYPDEEIFIFRLKQLIERPFFVLIFRILFLINRNGFLIIRNLFKGNLNQPLQPALLTSEGARTAKRNSPPHTPPDKIFKNQSAGKPAPRSSAHQPTNAAPAGKPTDERRFHPAILMVKEITKRFPKKEFWDRMIREIGDKPNVDFFRKSFERWRGVRGHFETYEKWLYEPNRTGKIPEIWGEKFNGNGGSKPPDVPKNEPPTNAKKSAPVALDERVLKAHLEDLRNEGFSADELAELEGNYTPGDWTFLMENLQK